MSASKPAGGAHVPIAFLTFTALTCGAMIMVVEVLGSRVVGPFYGVSLFVWTSLITVTMLALAGGYALGGWLSDKRDSPDWLYGIILAAGLLVLAIPFVKAPVLKACLPLGLRGGSLVSALLLFGPSLLLMGCVSPFLVKIATREMTSLGRTVGSFYAVSTIGSVLGTVVTGFYLIALLGIDRIFQAVGGVLVLLAVSWFAGLRGRWPALALLLAPPLLSPPPAVTSAVLDNGTRVDLVAAVDDHYGSLKVLDYSANGIRVRELVIDGLIQGGVDPSTGASVHRYSYLVGFLTRALQPEARTALVVGVGAGIIPAWYEDRGVRTDIVDINPEVVALAREHFAFEPRGQVYIEDARTLLARIDQRYDYVVLDVFTGDTTPGHLLTREALGLLADRLAPGGVVAVNMVGSLQGETFMTASVIQTLQTAFDTVEIVPSFELGQGVQSGNLTVLAYQGPRRSPDMAVLAQERVHPLAGPADLARLFQGRFSFPADTPAIVLTDDYNPMDVYDSDVREGVRRDIISGTDPDILIGSAG